MENVIDLTAKDVLNENSNKIINDELFNNKSFNDLVSPIKNIDKNLSINIDINNSNSKEIDINNNNDNNKEVDININNCKSINNIKTNSHHVKDKNYNNKIAEISKSTISMHEIESPSENVICFNC